MTINAMDPQLLADLRQDEGTILKPYKDSRGFLTIGTGRNLTSRGITATEADYLLANDVDLAISELDRITPWWHGLDEPRQRVLINLCFNMGASTLATFTTFLGFLQEHDYASAAADLQDTEWFTEVGLRGPRMVERLLANGS